eukprot:Em0002g1082a
MLDRSSPWLAPAVYVPKKSSEIRICIDYRELNKQTVKDACRCQTKFKTDSLDPKCSQSSTCILDTGNCQMPFGVTGGPSSFQRLMDKVLHGLPFATSYIDDVLVHSPNMKCHLQHLQQVFERLANAGLTLRGSKCQLGLDKVHYLGHVFSEAGMSPDKEKIAVIKDWPISNANADALSRVPTIPSTCGGTVTVRELTLEDVAQEQGKDEVLNEPTALKANHDIISSGHQGVEKTLQRLKRTAYWIGIAMDTELYCRSCMVCQRSKLDTRSNDEYSNWTPLADVGC